MRSRFEGPGSRQSVRFGSFRSSLQTTTATNLLLPSSRYTDDPSGLSHGSSDNLVGILRRARTISLPPLECSRLPSPPRMPLSFSVSDLAVAFGVQNDGDSWQHRSPVEKKARVDEVKRWMHELHSASDEEHRDFMVSPHPYLCYLRPDRLR